MAKLEHKKELAHIKEQEKKDTENEKKEETICEKEKQNGKLEEATGINQGFIPNKYKKGIHEQIINNFRENEQHITTNLHLYRQPQETKLGQAGYGIFISSFQ